MATALAEGLNFTITDEQRALRELAHDFAEKEIRPRSAEYGGPELGLLDGALVGEELCWGCSGMGTAIAVNGLGVGPVIIAGTDEQKRTWLAPLA